MGVHDEFCRSNTGRKKPHVVLFIYDQMQFQRRGIVDTLAVTPTLELYDPQCRNGLGVQFRPVHAVATFVCLPRPYRQPR